MAGSTTSPPKTYPTSTSPITLLASVTPTSSSRAWQTAAHSRLPLLATCSSDKAVNIYSLTSFTLLSTVSGGHKRSIRTVAWKPGHTSDSVLATGSFDASVGIWRQDDDATNGVGGAPQAIDFTGADKGDDEEDEDWRFALVLDGHDSEVKSVAWSAGGNLLATCSRDKSVWIWEEVGEDDFETIAVLQEHSADVKCVTWHPEEELLASGSYDDDVRLWREDVDDWDCVAVLRGHESTVWAVEFEGLRPIVEFRAGGGGVSQGVQADWVIRREASGPRLLSASDDRSVRVWRRTPKERKEQNSMSIIRTGSIEEEWVEEAKLPVVHECPIYSVAWSRKTGRVVSAGGDGKLVVYEERWTEAEVDQESSEADQLDGSGMDDSHKDQKISGATAWHVVAEFEGAHGVYEINHVTWAKRADKGKTSEDEEVIVSTGDDGAVKVWSLAG